MIKIYIYSLTDPISNDIKYIGKSNNPKVRYYNHLYDAKRDIKTKKTNWIRKLIKSNEKPILDIIEVCNSDNWEEREIYWIDKIKPKCNQRKGGGGTPKNNSEYIKKISNSVLQYDIDGNFIKEYKSLNEASRESGIPTPNISKNCNGILKHAGFYIWKFRDKNPKKINLDKPKSLRIKNRIVLQYDIDGNLIMEYESIRQSSEKSGIKRTSISNCCFKNNNNNNYTSSGYIWRFKDKVNEL